LLFGGAGLMTTIVVVAMTWSSNPIRLSVSNILVKVEQVQATLNGPAVPSIILIADVTFSNESRRLARSSDLRLTIERQSDGQRWLFKSEVSVDRNRLLQGVATGANADERGRQVELAGSSPFNPPAIAPHGTVEVTVVFYPASGAPVDPGQLNQGVYNVVVETIDNGKAAHVQRIVFELTKQRIDVLREGKVFGVGM